MESSESSRELEYVLTADLTFRIVPCSSVGSIAMRDSATV